MLLIAMSSAESMDASKGCRQTGPLLACAVHAAISPMSRGESVTVEAAISLQLTNTSKLPVAVFYPGGDSAFLPDKGPVINSYTAVQGMPSCGNPIACANDPKFRPLRLEQGNSANVTVTMRRSLPVENVQRMASATTAMLTAVMYVVDGDGHLAQQSLSLPVMDLDNGLTGK
jgi:hypothetical protein